MLTDTCPIAESGATALLDQAGGSEANPEGSPGVSVPYPPWCDCLVLRTLTEVECTPVLILQPQAQVLELSHEVFQLFAEGCSDGCASSLT
jgi:hypothetical protein